MLFANGSKRRPRGAKRAPRGPKRLPRGLRRLPRGPRRAPREPRRGTKTLPRDFQDQHDPKLAPDNPSTAPNQSILSLLSSFFSPLSSILSCLFLLVSPVLSFLSSSLLGSTLFFFAMLCRRNQSKPQSIRSRSGGMRAAIKSAATRRAGA